ncbi:MAG: VTT domain-containing protein [Sphingomonadaceae bacterium]
MIDLSALLTALATCPPAFFLAVVLATFVLEDATAIAVGALGAAMQVDPALGLAALLLGTVLGDLVLHLAGRLGRDRPWVARRVAGAPRVARLARSGWMVAAARAVPGLRVPAYVGSGVAGMTLVRFTLVVAATGALWTPALFLLGSRIHGSFAWAGLAGLALLLALVPALLDRQRPAPAA